MKRPSRNVPRLSGRTSSGCRSPRSASPRTAPRVRKTARTVPRKRIANIARPASGAPPSTSGPPPPREPLGPPSALGRAGEGPRRLEGLPRPEPVEDEEGDGEQPDDEEHAAPQ